MVFFYAKEFLFFTFINSLIQTFILLILKENVKLPATVSYSSGAPSITELAELTSQMPTVNLPSLSDSQLSKMFTPQVLSLEDNDNNPSQASTIELPAIDSFHSTQSNEELARAQAEDRKVSFRIFFCFKIIDNNNFHY